MKRREFITLLGGAAVAWPRAVRAQRPAAPVIAFIGGRSADASMRVAAAFRKGLNEAGYVEGQNAASQLRHSPAKFAVLYNARHP